MNLPSDFPSFLRSATDLGPTPGSNQISLRLYLAGRNPDAEAGRLRRVADPQSSSYAHYLSTAAFARTYGPTSTQLATLRSWLEAQGMTVRGHNLHFLAVRSTVKEADTAFAIQLHDYEFGATPVRAPVGDPSLPPSVRPAVATVLGLYEQGNPSGSASAVSRQMAGATANSAKDRLSTPETFSKGVRCSSWWGQHHANLPTGAVLDRAPTAVCGYTPRQLREAYGVGAGAGKGRTVAVILDGNLSSMRDDADRFFAVHHVAGFTKGQFRESLNPRLQATCRGEPGGGADLPEEPIDVEMIHTIAPAARVVYVGAGCSDTDQSFLDAETEVVDDHLANVSTDSFSTLESSWTPAMTMAWTLLMEQGGLEGIGFDFDSGDFGGAYGVQFPASDPYATSVGGTSLEIGRTGSVVGELGWGDDVAQENAAGTSFLQKPPGPYDEGSTGGPSEMFAEPWYQKGIVTEPAGKKPMREQPDVAADASPETGLLIGYTPPEGTFFQTVEGGTSAASPLVAALEADAAHRAGHALGFANPALYALQRTPAVRDIVMAPGPQSEVAASGDDCDNPTGNACLITMGRDDVLHVARGWDDVTGIGAATNHFIDAFSTLRPASVRP